MGSLFSSPSPGVVPPPPPPPANPATAADAGVQGAGAQARLLAAAAGGKGFDDTLLTGPLGAPTPPTAKKTLGG